MGEKGITNETSFWKQKPDRARCASHLLGAMLAKGQGAGEQSRGCFQTVTTAMVPTVKDITSRLIQEHCRGSLQLRPQGTPQEGVSQGGLAG